MKKFTHFILLLFISITLLSTDALAGRMKPKKKYSLKWKEQNHLIINQSICGQYGRGTLDYRQCRSYALDYFRARCRKHAKRYQNAGGDKKSRERRLKRKYCSAARKLP